MKTMKTIKRRRKILGIMKRKRRGKLRKRYMKEKQKNTMHK